MRVPPNNDWIEWLFFLFFSFLPGKSLLQLRCGVFFSLTAPSLRSKKKLALLLLRWSCVCVCVVGLWMDCFFFSFLPEQSLLQLRWGGWFFLSQHPRFGLKRVGIITTALVLCVCGRHFSVLMSSLLPIANADYIQSQSQSQSQSRSRSQSQSRAARAWWWWYMERRTGLSHRDQQAAY